MAETALVCMAYGSPRSLDGVADYFTHIRGGRPPSADALSVLVERYRAIGGGSPLAEITERQASALGERLGVPAFVAMKHSPPFAEETLARVRERGFDRVVVLPLAPHYADMSVGGYERQVRAAWSGELEFIGGFSEHPAFIRAVAERVAGSLAQAPADRVFFTAHSLPRRVVEGGDPYDQRLLESARRVAESVPGMPAWEFAYQSASATGEPWLGPDLLDALDASGSRRPLVCPIGFVADHLEILFDLDVEAQEHARRRGIELRRTRSFNDDPEFIAALAEVVSARL